MASGTAKLFVIATPIGNLDDLSARALAKLGQLGALACEDTRQTLKIFQRFDLPRPRHFFSCHAHNERTASRRVLALLAAGETVGLVSDAGMPGLSDPGTRLVATAIEAGYEVEVLPGPSAIPTALLASGFATARFSFLGFLPQRRARRLRLLAAYGALEGALVLFESPRRLARLLAEAAEVLGDRRAALCFELTKLHERVMRGHLLELTQELGEEIPRGEVTLVIAPALEEEPEASPN